MTNVGKIEVYYNEWIDKYVVALIGKDESYSSAFQMFKTKDEVNGLVEKIKKTCPYVKVEIYE